VYSDEEGQIAAARRLREAMLKGSPLVGFPKVLRLIPKSDRRESMVSSASEVVSRRTLQQRSELSRGEDTTTVQIQKPRSDAGKTSSQKFMHSTQIAF